LALIGIHASACFVAVSNAFYLPTLRNPPALRASLWTIAGVVIRYRLQQLLFLNQQLSCFPINFYQA
jgi:hypothetical protein